MTLTGMRTTQVPLRALGLMGLIAVADLMIWDVRPGIGLAVLILLAGAVAAAFKGGAPRRAWILLIMCCLPLVEKVQAVSMIFAWGGLTVFCAMLVTGGGGLWSASLRLPAWAVAQNVKDLAATHKAPTSLNLQGLTEWIIPVLLGLIFVALFAAANPIIDDWLGQLASWEGPRMPHRARLVLWGLCAFAFWPLMRLHKAATSVARPLQRPRLKRARVLNAGSVFKSLATFNLIFAVQTVSDLAFLTGGVALPDGMTYAEYAHRGPTRCWPPRCWRAALPF